MAAEERGEAECGKNHIINDCLDEETAFSHIVSALRSQTVNHYQFTHDITNRLLINKVRVRCSVTLP